MTAKEYIVKRFKQLVKQKVDPERAYFQATVEFFSGNQVKL